MKGFFDTSVLVPVFYGDHVHHQASLELFIQFDKSIGSCGAHSLAEVYSTLTRMPGKHRISGEQAMLFIGSIRERLFNLPDETVVHPGHGRDTTIGQERPHLDEWIARGW